jgi:hypothetical protein
MSTHKKFSGISIRKITGGKDPTRIIQDMIVSLDFDPKECEKSKTADGGRWVIPISDSQELEILADGLKNVQTGTVYLGLNICLVPLRDAHALLTVALELADGLVGIKVSLVGHSLILSATLGASGLTLDELEYHYKLITAQESWFKEKLLAELGWEELPG